MRAGRDKKHLDAQTEAARAAAEERRFAENRRNSIPYLGLYPLKYHEFKKHFAWTNFLYLVAYP